MSSWPIRKLLENRFIRESGIYVFSSALGSAIPLLLMPVLTRYLDPWDYGVVAMGNMVVQVLVLVVGLNGFGLVTRTFYEKDPESLQRVLTATLTLATAMVLVLFALSPFLGGFVEKAFGFPAAWFGGLLIIGLSTVIQMHFATYLRNRRMALRFALFEVAVAACNAGLALLFVVGMGMDWRGRMLGLLILGAGVSVFCMRAFGGRFGLLTNRLYDREKIRALAAFGVPLIPHSIGGMVMFLAARLWLTHRSGLGDVGIYNVAFNLASPMLLVAGSLQKAFQPALFGFLADDARRDLGWLARVLLLAICGAVVAAVLYGIAVYFCLPLIVGPEFRRAGGALLWLAMAGAVQGIYFIFASFVIYSKQTRLIAWRGDFLGAIVMLSLCPVLIAWHGVNGAAAAYFIAVSATAVGCLTASRKAYPMPWRAAIGQLAASGGRPGSPRRGGESA